MDNLDWCNHSINAKHSYNISPEKRNNWVINGLAKLDDCKVLTVITLKNYMKRKEIADHFNVSRQTIDALLKR